jgi:eukaryotic-like serine/threonine-protein kinase
MSFPDMSAQRETQARERVGLVLRQKWRLERLIGVGGMAAVYAAVHRNGMRGAVKVLHPELAALAEARERFVREGYAANAVGHDGVVRVLDDDVTEDGTAFLAMELLAGTAVDVLARERGGCLGLDEVGSIATQLLDVLAAAHAKGIWHRDLKPENLFLTTSGRLKVLDFGIAKVKQSAQANARATTTGSVLGSPAFMPPEQALGRWAAVDGRSDLFAVGATLFALLTGDRVHAGETATEVLVSAATRPVPPVRATAPWLPAPVAEVLDCALAYDKQQRFADAGAMQRAWAAAMPPEAPVGTASAAPPAGGHAPTVAFPAAWTPRPSHGQPVVVATGGAEIVALPSAGTSRGSQTAIPVAHSIGRAAPAPRGGFGVALVAFALAALAGGGLLAARVLGSPDSPAAASGADARTVEPATAEPTNDAATASTAVAAEPPPPTRPAAPTSSSSSPEPAPARAPAPTAGRGAPPPPAASGKLFRQW